MSSQDKGRRRGDGHKHGQRGQGSTSRPNSSYTRRSDDGGLGSVSSSHAAAAARVRAHRGGRQGDEDRYDATQYAADQYATGQYGSSQYGTAPRDQTYFDDGAGSRQLSFQQVPAMVPASPQMTGGFYGPQSRVDLRYAYAPLGAPGGGSRSGSYRSTGSDMSVTSSADYSITRSSRSSRSAYVPSSPSRSVASSEYSGYGSGVSTPPSPFAVRVAALGRSSQMDSYRDDVGRGSDVAHFDRIGQSLDVDDPTFFDRSTRYARQADPPADSGYGSWSES